MHPDSTTPGAVSPTPAQAAQAGYDEALAYLERYAASVPAHSDATFTMTCAVSYVRGARPGSFAAACIARGVV